jgi:uncharacterized protein with NAD-binding domain and iron-sulfur cluster
VNRNSSRKKVVVLGGGIAGMSAAHELIERGFDVEVFERKTVAGGKARSIAFDMPGARRGSRPGRDPAAAPLPGEHGFRFFPRFYRHVVDTMARIPFPGGSVAENLVETSRLHVARFDLPSFFLPSRFPRAPDDLRVGLYALVALIAGQIEVPLDEATVFAEKLWRIVTSCEERRSVEYERVDWWDFIEAEGRSEGYKKYFGSGITRSLVAAKARRASAKTIGDVFVQIVFDILQPGVSADRVLCGPTNDVWIDPWLAYLRQRGVAYHLGAEVRSIHCERGAVRSATVAIGNRDRSVEGDYFIAALPVERMAELLSPDLLRGDPSLANLNELTEYVEWMNGIQFYLRRDVPIAPGHTIYIDSPWALTSISQPQFWRGFDLTKCGDGEVSGLLSVDISDWDVRGLNGKEARECTRAEIAAEVWAQLKRSLNVGGQELLRDGDLHSWFLDPDISDLDPATPGLEMNVEPLLVNYVDTWRLRPEASTRIENFFVASDYVRTHTDLATMEAANEAARRAVNGVIRAARANVAPCEIWNLQEPEVFLPLRAHDRIRFRKGLPWDGGPLAGAAFGLAAFAARAASPSGDPRGREVPADPTGSQTVTTAAARESSSAGLRRLRVVG